MSFTLVGLALFGLLYFWGIGLGVLVLPRAWRRFWPVFVPLGGVAAVSAVVWVAAQCRLPGTASYAQWTWPVPVLLAVAAGWLRMRGGPAFPAMIRAAAAEFGRLSPVLAVALAVLVLNTRLMDAAAPRPTSFSAGSCDAADYAAGARVFRDFSIDDRTGQLGNAEVVELHGNDNFPGHWLRQNHFTPPAVIAWWSGALGYKIHEMVTLAGAVFLAAAVPLAFWAGRGVLGLGPWASLLLAAAFGISGTQLYAVAHVALAQQIAAGAVVLLTWAGLGAWRAAGSWRGALRWLPVLGVAVWLFLGAYNFMLLFAPAALGCWLAAEVCRTGDWGRLLRVGAVAAAAAALAGLMAPARVLGLAERFDLFEEFDFGWFIPGFSPERWYGWFGDDGLGRAAGATPWVVGAVFVAALLVWTASAVGHDRRRLRLAAACTLPALAGYGWLVAQGYAQGTNDTYNAYKVFAVFHPLILAGLCVWLGRARAPGRAPWPRVVLGAGLLAAHWFGAAPLRAAIANPRLVVGREIPALRRIEEMPDVGSLNMVLEPFWDRLWANGFLLRKPQYFRTYTYETRRPTPLRGEWDLCDRSILIDTGADTRLVGTQFFLLRRGPRFVEAAWADGWFPPERAGAETWAWSGGVGRLRLRNPQGRALSARFVFRIRSIVPRAAELWSPRGVRLWQGPVGTAATPVEVDAGALPPGESVYEIRLPEPPVAPPGDSRKLGVALYDLTVVVGDAPAVPAP